MGDGGPCAAGNGGLDGEVGSTAHGTGIAGGEDHDQLAVVVETPGQVLGLDPHGFRTVMQRTQPEGVPSLSAGYRQLAAFFGTSTGRPRRITLTA